MDHMGLAGKFDGLVFFFSDILLGILPNLGASFSPVIRVPVIPALIVRQDCRGTGIIVAMFMLLGVDRGD